MTVCPFPRLCWSVASSEITRGHCRQYRRLSPEQRSTCVGTPESAATETMSRCSHDVFNHFNILLSVTFVLVV